MAYVLSGLGREGCDVGYEPDGSGGCQLIPPPVSEKRDIPQVPDMTRVAIAVTCGLLALVLLSSAIKD